MERLRSDKNENRGSEFYAVRLDPNIRSDGPEFTCLPVADANLEKQTFNFRTGLFSTVAGNGHRTPLLAMLHGIDNALPRIDIGGISEVTHALGSNKGATIITKYLLRFPKAQIIWETFHRSLLLKDLPEYEAAAAAAIRRTEGMSGPENSFVAVCLHPEMVMALGMLREKLEKDFPGLKIIVVNYLTDHYPDKVQYNQALSEADITVAPDRNTAMAVKKMLEVEDASGLVINMGGFPLEPNCTEKIPEEGRRQRISNLSPASREVKVVSPFGGSAPQKDLVKEIVGSLSHTGIKWKWQFTLNKPKSSSQDYQNWLEAMNKHGALIIEGQTPDETIDVTHRLLGNLSDLPDLIMVRPSEKANLALLTPKMSGGAPLAFLPPIGAWEEFNLDFLRSKEGGMVVLSEAEEKEFNVFLHRFAAYRPIQFLDRHPFISGLSRKFFDNIFKKHDNALEAERLKWLERAKTLRGICLPDNPAEAAFILESCKDFGIFQAMAKYEKDYQPEEEDLDSYTAFHWPGKLSEAVKQALAKRNEGYLPKPDPRTLPKENAPPLEIRSVFQTFLELVSSDQYLKPEEKKIIAGAFIELFSSLVKEEAGVFLNKLATLREELRVLLTA